MAHGSEGAEIQSWQCQFKKKYFLNFISDLHYKIVNVLWMNIYFDKKFKLNFIVKY